MDRIEMLMRASLPPSPVPSPQRGPSSESDDSESTKDNTDTDKCTPTKVLDVAKDNNR